MQINKDNIIKNIERLYHKYKVGDKSILNNIAEYKYYTPYKNEFQITQCCINGMVMSKTGVTKNRYNIYHIKPYK